MEKKLCIAIGDFDGVHLGHKEIISTAASNNFGHTPAVFTFESNCKNARLITDNQTKTDLINELGIKNIIFYDFAEIKNMSAEEFIEKILIEKYNAGSIVCGADFRFGKNAAADAKTMQKVCKKYNVKVIAVPELLVGISKLSSSDIRELITDGEIEKATDLLGHTFSISGTVVHGKRLATENNTPTININIQKGMIVPAYGVYVTKITIDKKTYFSISNVGVRPSVESTKNPNIETHIFDFCDNVYDKKVRIEFIKMIRPEIKFKNQELLFEQINNDIQMAKNYFNGERND